MAVLINLLSLLTKDCTTCGKPSPFLSFYPKIKRDGTAARLSICPSCCAEYRFAAYELRTTGPGKHCAILFALKKARIIRCAHIIAERKAASARRRKEKASIREKTNIKVIAYRKAYKHRPDRIERHKEWSREPRRVIQRNKLNRIRRATDPQFNLNGRISCAIYSALRKNKAGRCWESLVGYALDDLVTHLESLFIEGMGWHNIGLWEIDHVIPKSAFIYNSPEEQAFKDCWGLANLQPLWMPDNRSKHNRIGWNGRLFPKLASNKDKAARKAERAALERKPEPEITKSQEEAWLF